MRTILLVMIMMFCVASYSQTERLIAGVKPIASKDAKEKLNMYKPMRETVKVEEGRLYFKGSAQGDFIMERPSYKCVVFDRTDPERWTIELHAVDGFNIKMAPEVSVYAVECCASLVENTFEAVILRSSSRGPAWTSLKVIETADGYVFELGDARDRWDGKIAMRWICKKGKYADPGKGAEAEVVILEDAEDVIEVIDVVEEVE